MKRIFVTIFFGVIGVSISACSNYYSEVSKIAKKTQAKRQSFHGGSMTLPDNASKKSILEAFKGGFHGDASASAAKPTKKIVVESLKKNKLSAYPQKSIGEAFDAYNKVAAKEWQENAGSDGKVYVDYICWFEGKALLPTLWKGDEVRTGLDIKFAIEESGETYIALATKLVMKTDGKVAMEIIPFSEMPKVVDAIYKNTKLSF